MIELERNAPDLEDLAAYLDGLLSGERKAQVEERLLRDEDYYEVYLENVRFQEEQSQQEDGGERDVISGPAAWWRSWRLIAPLAMAAMMMATIGLWRLSQGPTTAEWVARLDAAEIVSREHWDDPGWGRLRGDNIERGWYRSGELAFRIGLRTVDLQVALAAENRDAARHLTAVLEHMTAAADLFVESAGYRRLLDQVTVAEFDVLASQAADIERLLAESYKINPSESQRFALGIWTEHGRLTALAGDLKVLDDIVRRQCVAQGIEKIEPHLQELEALLEQPDPNFEAAEKAFSKIARALAGRG